MSDSYPAISVWPFFIAQVKKDTLQVQKWFHWTFFSCLDKDYGGQASQTVNVFLPVGPGSTCGYKTISPVAQSV